MILALGSKGALTWPDRLDLLWLPCRICGRRRNATSNLEPREPYTVTYYGMVELPKLGWAWTGSASHAIRG